MVVKLTQEQAYYLKTFNGDNERAFYYISRWGLGFLLKNGQEIVYKTNKEAPFNLDEKEKMLNAIINGYEVINPKFKFYNYADVSGSPLYYVSSEKELDHCEEFAKEVEEGSEEYAALEKLGFYKEEV